jgi:hypothetical protein
VRALLQLSRALQVEQELDAGIGSNVENIHAAKSRMAGLRQKVDERDHLRAEYSKSSLLHQNSDDSAKAVRP